VKFCPNGTTLAFTSVKIEIVFETTIYALIVIVTVALWTFGFFYETTFILLSNIND
jgi:hypothetical protein